MAKSAGKRVERKARLCPDCEQPMLPKGVKKLPNEYDHASGCPREKKKGEFPKCPTCGERVTTDWDAHECPPKTQARVERKARKPRYRKLKFRKGDLVNNLYAATQHYVHAHGGNAVVMGGVEVQEWPSDGALIYRVAVRVLGRKPNICGQSEEKKTPEMCKVCGKPKWRCVNEGHSAAGKPGKERR